MHIVCGEGHWASCSRCLFHISFARDILLCNLDWDFLPFLPLVLVRVLLAGGWLKVVWRLGAPCIATYIFWLKLFNLTVNELFNNIAFKIGACIWICSAKSKPLPSCHSSYFSLRYIHWPFMDWSFCCYAWTTYWIHSMGKRSGKSKETCSSSKHTCRHYCCLRSICCWKWCCMQLHLFLFYHVPLFHEEGHLFCIFTDNRF